MNYEMTGQEVEDAVEALLIWTENQDINIYDTVRVLTTCLVATIHEIAARQGLNAKDGGRIITDIIMKSLP